MKNKKDKSSYKGIIIISILLIAAVVLLVFFGTRNKIYRSESGVGYVNEFTPPYTARPSADGRLHVEGINLVNSEGTAVQLRGVSTHGLTWYPEFINQRLFTDVSTGWNCNMIRLAMYASQYSGGEKEKSLDMLRKGIEYVVKADMYVLVD